MVIVPSPVRVLWRSLVLPALVLLLIAGQSFGQTRGASEKHQTPFFLLSSDTLEYDEERGIVTATGNVEVARDDRVLLADSLTYNQNTDVLVATGNVSLLESTDEVLFAEYMEMTGDMKDGILKDIRLILSDGALMAANGGRRSKGTVSELSKAVYSPCRLCETDPTRPPLWQLKAIKVVHDNDEKMIEYEDAWLEAVGIPVAYIPYFAHPDPTVKRKSGFLAPSYGSSSDLGFMLKIPYFWNIAPNQDLTVTPFITSEEGPVLEAEYRHLFVDGMFKGEGSVTRDSSDNLRGHFIGSGLFHLNRTWRWGFNAERASDDTYQRRYGFPTDNTLVSRFFVEGFRKRNYLSVDSYSYQPLTENIPESPLVLPMINFNHVGEPDRFGGRTNLDINLLALIREDLPSTDTQRLSIKAGWQKSGIGRLGDIYKFSASVRGDLYHVDSLPRNGKSDFSGVTGRFFPQASLEWRYPFVKRGGKLRHVVEPMASVIASPYGGNPDTIPNEDSLEPELDTANLFTESRFYGLDQVDGGPRVNYGLKWSIFGPGSGTTSVQVAQSYRFRDDDTFEESSGLEDNQSDIVGTAIFSPGNLLNFVYRARFGKEDLDLRRSELALNTGVPALSLSANYLFFATHQDSEFSGREEISFSLQSQINQNWRFSASGLHDLGRNGGLRSLGLSLSYENECVVFSTRFSRSFFEDRDLRPTDTVLFQLTLKTLGEGATGFTASQQGQ